MSDSVTASATQSRDMTVRTRALVLLIVAMLGASVPLWTGSMPFVLILASQAVIAAIVALSLDLLMGSTGLLSFGHAAWYGFGAYLTGLAAKYLTPEMLVVLPLTLVATIVLSAIIGFVLVRQIGKTFAILTLALGQIMGEARAAGSPCLALAAVSA